MRQLVEALGNGVEVRIWRDHDILDQEHDLVWFVDIDEEVEARDADLEKALASAVRLHRHRLRKQIDKHEHDAHNDRLSVERLDGALATVKEEP